MGGHTAGPLRVLYVSHSEVAWGAEQSLFRVVPKLADRNIEPVLAAPSGGVFADRWRALGFETVDLALPRHDGLRRGDGSGERASPAQMAGEAATLVRSVGKLRPLMSRADVVHSQALGAHLEVATAGRLARRPTVLQLHDMVKPGMGRRVLTGAARLASAVVAITQACADCVGDAARDRVAVIRHGIDLVQFAPGPADPAVLRSLGGGPGVRLIGILGRLHPSKQVDVLVAAVAQLRPRDERVVLAVVGGDFTGRGFSGYGNELRARAQEVLGDRVRFAGARSDVAAVVQALDVLVNASVAEPFGTSLLEAQACGIPVVATASGGAPEFVLDGTTGLLVPPGDPSAMAVAIDRLLDDPGLRRRLAAGGRQQAERLYTLDRKADEFAELYLRLARSPSAVGRGSDANASVASD